MNRDNNPEIPAQPSAPDAPIYNAQAAFKYPGMRVIDSPTCPPPAKGEFLCTLMPPDHPLIPGPYSVCLFTTAAHHVAFLTVPSFPRPVITPSPPIHRLDPTNNPHGLGLGRGIFASSPIPKKGDLIISERPMLVLPYQLRAIELNFPPSFQASPQQKMRLQLQQYNVILESCVNRLDRESRDAFWELPTAGGDGEGFGPIMNRMQMNGTFIQIACGEEEEEEVYTSVALSKNISRIGHR
ncbi:hypothetical protein H0H93_007890 [Arthromyces matolae]|nr:hypothetical protein H0H93_007890 [Arthromyces matolae]